MISAAVHACRLLPLLHPVFCFLHAGSGFTWFHSNWADKSVVSRIKLSLICLGIRGSSVLHFLLFIHHCVTWGHTLPKHTDLFKRQPCRGRHANTRYPVNRPTLSHFRSKRNIYFFLSKLLTEKKNPQLACGAGNISLLTEDFTHLLFIQSPGDFVGTTSQFCCPYFCFKVSQIRKTPWK